MKIHAIILGETAGDILSITMNVGYAMSSWFGIHGSSFILFSILAILFVYSTLKNESYSTQIVTI